jgi:hypothetical protein
MSDNLTSILEVHTTRCWPLFLLVASAIAFVIFKMGLVFETITVVKVDCSMAREGLPYCRLHIHRRSLPSLFCCDTSIGRGRTSSIACGTTIMKCAVGFLSLNLYAQSVQALPQGFNSDGSSSSEMTIPRFTPTLQPTTVITSIVPTVQTTSTTAVPDTTGVSVHFTQFLSLVCIRIGVLDCLPNFL